MSIRKQYDTDLEALKAALVEMGSNSAEAVEAALEALCTADAEAAQKIVKGDSRINNMERDIEHRCMTLLLRQQPVAGDLRRISTAMKVVTDIERIADQASDIAEITLHLHPEGARTVGVLDDLYAMGDIALHMVKDAIAAADAVKPNAFSEETKFQWLRRLEGRLQAEVFLMAPAQIRELDLQYPADMDRELLVDPPYDDLYPLYLQARIDAENGEYNKYADSMTIYNSAYTAFVCWFCQTYDPAEGYCSEEARRHEVE